MNAAEMDMKEAHRDKSHTPFVSELKWRLFAGFVGFALFYALDQSVHAFIQWYIGADASLASSRHPLYALGELSRVVCSILAMAVVLVALARIKLPCKESNRQGDAGK